MPDPDRPDGRHQGGHLSAFEKRAVNALVEEQLATIADELDAGEQGMRTGDKAAARFAFELDLGRPE